MTTTIESSRRTQGAARSRVGARQEGVPTTGARLGTAEDWVPERVRSFFRTTRGSRRRRIWVHMVHSARDGWQTVDWASPKLLSRHGHQPTAKAWPVDLTMAQWTDGEIFADFTRQEMLEPQPVVVERVTKAVALLRRHVAQGGGVRVETAAGLELAQWRGKRRPQGAVALATDTSSGDFLTWLDARDLAVWTGDQLVNQAAQVLLDLGKGVAA